MTEIKYDDNLKLICSYGDGLNYQEVLDDFENAKKVRIVTYNISKKTNDGSNLKRLMDLPEGTDIQIITNIPNHWDTYFKGAAQKYRDSLELYLGKLNPELYNANNFVGFKFDNHAKLIGTDNILYIGSANYSDESARNEEMGFITTDKDFIEKVYKEIFETTKIASEPYFDDPYNALRLFIVGFEVKYKVYIKLLEEGTIHVGEEGVFVTDGTNLSTETLVDLYNDFDIIQDIENVVDDLYDEENEDEYNDLYSFINELKELDLSDVQDSLLEDGNIYNLIVFDDVERANEILQNEYASEAWDENLDRYVEIAMQDAHEELSELKLNAEYDLIALYKTLVSAKSIFSRMHDYLLSIASEHVNTSLDNT
ncbi:phospholipase D-like domain-containing protein [Eubacterium oxidoreducens]|uniref:PLD-like domain-containing protein n=1 Tax=Eubacterium oxidoreducens TaxID=1732 RepID=A0A1G6A0G0_EUBOX|nr:phospholipase D-like domain-containing protein [Eubacterium oxidoreducens]SDB01885.1 PLD-like domain-containing protein [Eubacterium oxidoreducens]